MFIQKQRSSNSTILVSEKRARQDGALHSVSPGAGQLPDKSSHHPCESLRHRNRVQLPVLQRRSGRHMQAALSESTGQEVESRAQQTVGCDQKEVQAILVPNRKLLDQERRSECLDRRQLRGGQSEHLLFEQAERPPDTSVARKNGHCDKLGEVLAGFSTGGDQACGEPTVFR